MKFAFFGEKNFNIIKMQGTTIKITDAQQTKLRKSYKNTKLKLLNERMHRRFNCKF
jgi:hypothetical protein